MIDTTRLDLFMERAGVRRFESPQIPNDETILRCAKIVSEESRELCEAIGYVVNPSGDLARTIAMPSLREVAKESVDLIYVAVYTMKAFGFSEAMIQEAWKLVADNNDAKFGEGSTRRPLDGKVIPPPGFVKEDLRSLIP